jgi:hypothetical protein
VEYIYVKGVALSLAAEANAEGKTDEERKILFRQKMAARDAEYKAKSEK